MIFSTTVSRNRSFSPKRRSTKSAVYSNLVDT